MCVPAAPGTEKRNISQSLAEIKEENFPTLIRRSIQSRMRNLTSGANSVIFEKYNVRAGFEAKKLFRKSVRLVVILMRAGGCFRRDESLKVSFCNCLFLPVIRSWTTAI